MDQSLAKINVTGRSYYLLTQYCKSQPSLKLTLSNGNDVWSGEVSEEQLTTQAEVIEKDPEAFFELTLKALTKEGIVNELFAYEVKSIEDSIKISWKQVLDDGIKFQLGNATLNKCSNTDNGIISIFDVAISQFKKMKGEIASLKNANEKLLDERKRTLKRLEDSVQAKETLERDLYLKFTTVLNNKKGKIRDLKKQVEDAVQGNHPKRGKGSDNDEKYSEEEENTDDEKEKEQKEAKKREISDEKDSESRIQGGAVILEKNEDEEDLAPAVKRRARARRQRGTASPTLPRTVSLPRPVKQNSGSKSQGSQPKSKSKGSDNPWSVDVDELMDEL